jgi:F420 biosynthesis protein FbiB-like protein
MTTDFWKIIFERHSVRRYLHQSVPNSVLERIINAASHAPSAHNNQPWHFVIITSSDIRNQLAQKMAKKYNKFMIAQGMPACTRKKRIQYSLKLFSEAPVIIIPFLANKRTYKKRSKINENLEEVMGIQSVAVAAGHMLLAAAASGLGACWYSAPLFCPDIVNRHLQVDIDWKPQALITLGYPDELPQPKKKKPLKNIMTYV